jgi:2,3-bisphosphoglycerate-independent phosphoglycerate mutase
MTDVFRSPVVFCILDGWGHRDAQDGNAIALADTPNFDRLMATSPHALLKTSAMDVGLPDGQMGNSEVGHTNLGAGRVVRQDLPRINDAVEDGSLGSNPTLTAFVEKMKKSAGTCHLLGLVSLGGVHSHQNHMVALCQILDQAGVPVAVHAILDGRDTPPKSALEFLAGFESDIAGTSGVKVATVTGRYFVMDRDQRWDRTELAYRTIAEGLGEKSDSAVRAVDAAYAADQSDEFCAATVIGSYGGMKDGILVANFRADRIRQILAALADPDFDAFKATRISFAATTGMIAYSAELDKLFDPIFPPLNLADTFGDVVSRAGLKQLRIAETEKYAHVTFFFNGGEERVFDGEERIMIPSPKVATYDLQPEMSAFELTDRLVAAINEKTFDVIIVNFANTDMVGHTGDLEAAKKAVAAVDQNLGRLERAVVEADGLMVITADHGNAEQMKDAATGQPHTAHTTGTVPLILVNAGEGLTLRDGRLADVAPTLLTLMGITPPEAMTGQSLIGKALIGDGADIDSRHASTRHG